MQGENTWLKKSYKVIPILLGIVMIFSFVVDGCSKGPPTCDSKNVKKAVIDQHIEDLRSQLNSKDYQINKLTETISTQSELLKNMQVLLKENKDQIKTLEEGKKSKFKKWFKKRQS